MGLFCAHRTDESSPPWILDSPPQILCKLLPKVPVPSSIQDDPGINQIWLGVLKRQSGGELVQIPLVVEARTPEEIGVLVECEYMVEELVRSDSREEGVPHFQVDPIIRTAVRLK